MLRRRGGPWRLAPPMFSARGNRDGAGGGLGTGSVFARSASCIVIFEALDTRELVKDKGWEFLFVLGPARMRGAVQMIINPIAIR